MPINIVCPGCKKRFSVNDKFAGKKGPCPKCKTEIEIPAAEDEIVIHGPEESLPKDSKGRAIIDPIMREETTVSTMVIVGIVVFIVVVFGIAFGLRAYEDDIPFFIKLLGAVSLAPPLVLGGYAFLRNDELEAYSGKELAIRVLVCSAVYATLWGILALVPWALGMEESFTSYQMAFVAIPFVLIGGFSALASFDLEYLMGTIHYGLYLIVTVLMRVVAGLDAF
jgi:cation transport ATPase